MFKNNLISLIYFVFCVILGLLLSNLLLIFILFLKGIDLSAALTDTASLLETLTGRELLITQMCSQVFSLIIPALIYFKLEKDDRKALQQQDFDQKFFILSLFFFIACMPVVALSSYLNQFLPLYDWMSETETQMNEMIERMLSFQSPADLIIAIIVIAVIPAIGEEWVFRGIIQNQLIRWFKNPWIGLLIASIFFSAIHMQFQGFLPRFLLGFILGLIYMLSGNLWHSIILHFFNNGFQVIGAYFYKEEILKQLQEPAEMPSLLLVSGSVIIIVILFLYLNKLKPENQHA